MPNEKQGQKVTIEQLLHLKRAERPGPDFWTGFEVELRQKQLSALMHRRRWWQELPHLLVRRAYLPLGASAALAFAFAAVRYYGPSQVVRAENLPSREMVGVDHQVAASQAATSQIAIGAPSLHYDNGSNLRAVDLGTVAASTLPLQTVESQPSLEPTAPVSVETPSARTIAANLAHLEESEPELMSSVLGSRLSASPRIQSVAAPVQELASIATNAGKRNRILAQYNERQLNPEPTAPDLVRERLSRRLGDTDYVERFSRIGLRGDQVSLGFTIKL